MKYVKGKGIETFPALMNRITGEEAVPANYVPVPAFILMVFCLGSLLYILFTNGQAWPFK
jgi:hypothetical protein